MADYLQLLQTQSVLRMLPDPERESLLTEVAEVLSRAGGRLTMDYLSRLYLARRK
jgi:hypothetical protein